MRAAVMPGEDPMTLPTPEEVAAAIVPLCLPGFAETGKIYDFRAGKLNVVSSAGVTAAAPQRGRMVRATHDGSGA